LIIFSWVFLNRIKILKLCSVLVSFLLLNGMFVCLYSVGHGIFAIIFFVSTLQVQIDSWLSMVLVQRLSFRRTTHFPVGEKAVCRSVFLTIWHYCIFSTELTKTHSFRLFFSAILPTGWYNVSLQRTSHLLPHEKNKWSIHQFQPI